MTTSPTKNLTLEEYLTYDDGTDNRYELVNGELVMVPLPTADHSDVIDLLCDTIRAEISRDVSPWIVKRDVGVYTGKSPKTGRDYSRTPDVCVMTSVAWSELKADKRAAAVLRTVPLMVVEVVSTNRKDDYVDKLDEYQRLGIPEYWIVDLQDKKVSVLLLNNGRYSATEFRGVEQIGSQTFPKLSLTAQQVLAA